MGFTDQPLLERALRHRPCHETWPPRRSDGKVRPAEAARIDDRRPHRCLGLVRDVRGRARRAGHARALARGNSGLIWVPLTVAGFNTTQEEEPDTLGVSRFDLCDHLIKFRPVLGDSVEISENPVPLVGLGVITDDLAGDVCTTEIMIVGGQDERLNQLPYSSKVFRRSTSSRDSRAVRASASFEL